MQADVIVVGGGIVGAATAWSLAREGERVTLFERGEIGREASWAAAGVLGTLHPWEYPQPLLRVTLRAAAEYGAFAAELEEETGIDLEYRVPGMLHPVLDDRDEADVGRMLDWRRRERLPAERLSAAAAREREPALSPSARGALLYPDVATIRNHRIARALAAAAARRGAVVRERVPVLRLVEEDGRVAGVRTEEGEVRARVTVLAAGAWSTELAATVGVALPVVPARGQIALLEATLPPIRHFVLRGEHYVVPRADGKLLVGSTVERVGFDASPTAVGVAGMLAGVLAMLPGAGAARFVTAWAGLRPDTPDHLPWLGWAREGLIAACGHFRSGILLAPVTGRSIAALALGRAPELDLGPFAPGRITRTR
jgi:glycine oxidase